jgi:hypothetical protein
MSNDNKIPIVEGPYNVQYESLKSIALNEEIPYYTIFQDKNVFRPKGEELLELSEAIGQVEIASIVSYKPERLALHWTAAYINFYAKIKDNNHFDDLVKDLYQTVLKDFENVSKKILNERSKIEKKVTTTIGLLQKGIIIDNSEISIQTQKVYNKVKSRSEQYLYLAGTYDSQETIEKVSIKLATDSLYNSSKEINSMLKEYVKEKIKEAIKDEKIDPLVFSKHGYRSFIVFSGPGGGKTSLSKAIAKFYGDEGVATITRDKFRRVLIDDYNNAVRNFKSTTMISQDESSAIQSKVQEVFKEISDQREGSPVSILESSGTSPAFENEVINSCDITRPCYIYFVSLPTEKAINRAYKRAAEPRQDTDRQKFIQTDVVIALHKRFGEIFEDTLVKNVDKNIIFEVVDNDVELGQQPLVTAFGKSGKNPEFNIYDFEELVEFMNKQFLNLEAKNASELYSFPQNHSELIKNSIERISKKYQVNFVDKDNRIYASFDRNGKINVHSIGAFKQIENNEVIGLFEKNQNISSQKFFDSVKLTRSNLIQR